MNIAVPMALAGLTLLDGCFSGFRAAAGRDARTAKGTYARAACVQGTIAGAVVVVVVAAYCLTTIFLAGEPYDEFVKSGQRLLILLLPFGALVLAALLGYVLIPRTGAQTLMSTLVLGPFTLIRPLVAAGAVAATFFVADDLAVRGGLVLAGVMVLAVEPILYRRPPPAVPPTPPRWALEAANSLGSRRIGGDRGTATRR